MKSEKHYAERARVLKALAHPTRLLIVDKLSAGEQCVADLTDLVGADMSTVSRHLALLREAGILHSEKRGACIYYQLKCPCVLNFFTCIESVLEGSS